MLKLYRISGAEKLYWETWEEKPGIQIVHWGTLGTRGESKTVKSGFLRSARNAMQSECNSLIEQGFAPVPPEAHSTLMIEYPVEGMGSDDDLAKRHQLEDRLNETLGWTGLGACDGGSIGSGTMEVCNFVVDFDLAKRVIEEDLIGTDFADYTRIYDEHAP